MHIKENDTWQLINLSNIERCPGLLGERYLEPETRESHADYKCCLSVTAVHLSPAYGEKPLQFWGMYINYKSYLDECKLVETEPRDKDIAGGSCV